MKFAFRYSFLTQPIDSLITNTVINADVYLLRNLNLFEFGMTQYIIGLGAFHLVKSITPKKVYYPGLLASGYMYLNVARAIVYVNQEPMIYHGIDLAQNDPYFVLPLIVGLFNYVLYRTNKNAPIMRNHHLINLCFMSSLATVGLPINLLAVYLSIAGCQLSRAIKRDTVETADRYLSILIFTFENRILVILNRQTGQFPRKRKGSLKMEEERRESLLCRFVINLTKEEKEINKFFFHLESAYWYYLDFLKPKDKMTQLQFYQWLLAPLNEFKQIRSNLKTLMKDYKVQSRRIPRYGAIILNDSLDSVLLVMNYSQTVYSFPKGKVNENESGIECAIREVWEEVSCDISKKIRANVFESIFKKDYIEFQCEETGQLQRMYIIHGVSQMTKFSTRTRYEIGLIEWVPLEDIFKAEARFHSLSPFISGLQKYLKHYKLNQGTKVEEISSLIAETLMNMLGDFRKELKSQQPPVQGQFNVFSLI